jgi:hypothetical protein
MERCKYGNSNGGLMRWPVRANDGLRMGGIIDEAAGRTWTAQLARRHGAVVVGAVASLVFVATKLSLASSTAPTAGAEALQLTSPGPSGDPLRPEPYRLVKPRVRTDSLTYGFTPSHRLAPTACKSTRRRPHSDAEEVKGCGRSASSSGKVAATTPPRDPAMPLPGKVEPVRAAAPDGYAQKGIVRDNFLFLPAVELKTGYDSNPARLPGGRGSPVAIVAPELLVRSLFDRHELNADLHFAYTDFTQQQNQSRPTADAKINGRYDATDTTAINAEGRYNLDIADPLLLTPVPPAAVPAVPLVQTFGGTVGVTQKFDPVKVSLDVAADRSQFLAGAFANGVVFGQAPNFTDYTAHTRVAYAVTPQFSPFVDVRVDQRIHDLPVDLNGFRRNSNGVASEVGAQLAFGSTLVGEVAFGYLTRNYADPALAKVAGFIADATLTYQPRQGTSVIGVVKSQAVETIIPATSGVLRRDAVVLVSQDFGERFTGMFTLGYGHDQFFGLARRDDRYIIGTGLNYKVSRLIQLKAEVQQELTRSNAIADVNATIVTVGARLQY